METGLSLLDAVRKLDENALVEVFDLYAPALYNYAYRSCNDAVMADQIVGEVFTKLLKQLATHQRPIISLRVYLYEIAYHLIVDRMDSSDFSSPSRAVDLLLYGGYSAEVSAENRALFDNTLRALTNDLTDKQRHVVVLRFLEGFSLKETAAITGIKVGNVKVIQCRATTVLREALGYPSIEISSIFNSLKALVLLNERIPADLFQVRLRCFPAKA